MLDSEFSIAQIVNKVIKQYPNMRFRDKDKFIHNASDAGKCTRQLTYKSLKTPPSNETDLTGEYRMRFGGWIEKGLMYDLLTKFSVMTSGKVGLLSTQGDCGEHGTFYGTSWHGYRDFELVVMQDNGKYKKVITELKTKVGKGAILSVKEKEWSKNYKKAVPDESFGHPLQLSLYLRDAWLKTKDNPSYSEPITDGVLLYFLYHDKMQAYLEFHFKYDPDTDTTKCYRLVCEAIPELNYDLDITYNLKKIADKWKIADEHVARGETAPPDFQRVYSVDDERVQYADKWMLEAAIKGDFVIGDIQCKYCPFRDKCAEDLKTNLTYTKDEKDIIKGYLKCR